jgi:integrase
MARPKLERPNYRLSKRSDRYHVQWWEDGKPQRVPTGQTDQRQAEVWLKQFIAGQGTPEAPARPTVDRILTGYLADRQAKPVRGYDTLVTNYKALTRHLGDLEPDHLTRERIRFYRRQRAVEGHEVGPADSRRVKPIQDGTILRELVTLRAALRWAKNEKWISEEPYIEVPSQPPPRDRWLTRDEADRLLEHAQALHVRTFLAVCLYTAARPGAVLQLTWPKVDMAQGLIDLGRVSGGKGRAVVPIAEKLRPYLEEARAAATCPFVVEHGGKPVASVKTGVRAAVRRAALQSVTPHTLRHSAATWMAMSGVPIEVIARVLGHTNSRTTWKVYAKFSPDYLRSAISALDGTGTAG